MSSISLSQLEKQATVDHIEGSLGKLKKISGGNVRAALRYTAL